MADPFHIVFALFPGVTHLDFTGPHQVLCRLPNSKVSVASVGGRPIEADGLTFSNLAVLEDIEHCDLICVPGGFGATEAALDPTFRDSVRRLGLQATYVTSVCTGSLILGAAGLLQGKRAACHWAWRDLLPLFGAIPDEGRVVRDGNVVTGGGVTAGIDFALTIAAEVAGADVAQGIQLMVEYAPAPPFDSGRPERAPPEVLERIQAFNDRIMPERRAQAEQAAAAMKAMA